MKANYNPRTQCVEIYISKWELEASFESEEAFIKFIKDKFGFDIKPRKGWEGGETLDTDNPDNRV